MTTDITPELDSWMTRNRGRRAIAAAETHLDRSTRRGAARALVPLDVLRNLIALVKV